MRLHSRKTAWCLTVLAIVFVLASAFFPAFACHHCCLGSSCPVCLQIQTWNTVLRLFGAGILSALILFAHHLLVKRAVTCAPDCPAWHSPVALKTKLLN